MIKADMPHIVIKVDINKIVSSSILYPSNFLYKVDESMQSGEHATYVGIWIKIAYIGVIMNESISIFNYMLILHIIDFII